MRPLSAAQMLALWETGQHLHPIDRALLALAMAMPDESPDALADRPLGWRERSLLALRNASFGAALDGYAACPACGALMEFDLDGNALLAKLPAPGDTRFQLDGRGWRLPNSRDQAAIVDAPDVESAVHTLLARCREDGEASPQAVAVDGKKWAKASYSSALIGALETRMEQLDPAANTRLGMHCADCGHAWDALLDIGACFWAELASHARQLMDSVHRLASAYGWCEADILALSPARRSAYLAMVDRWLT